MNLNQWNLEKSRIWWDAFQICVSLELDKGANMTINGKQVRADQYADSILSWWLARFPKPIPWGHILVLSSLIAFAIWFWKY